MTNWMLTVGTVLVLITTALEIRTWWLNVQEQDPSKGRRASLVVFLNLAAAFLLVASQLR
jgi:hypothetical protein